MNRIGIAGIGFMGWIHWLAYQRLSNVEVAAISTRDAAKRAGDWTSIQGNFGPPGEQVNLDGIATHESLDDLLNDSTVDLVDLCLPPHVHVDATLKAFEAGKHVFCEKPLALTAEECDTLVKASEAAGKQLLVGHVLPFFPEFAEARRVIQSGDYGRLLGGSFKRVISDPLWLSDFYEPQKVGGPMIDLHVHDAHLIRLLFGMPTSVDTTGRFRGDVVEYFQSVYRFNDPSVVVSACGGVINQQGRPFTHGFEIHLERATLQFEFAGFTDAGEVMPFKILTHDGEVLRPELTGGSDPIQGFVAEIEEVMTSVNQNEPSNLLSGNLARDAIILCQQQTESARLGKPISLV
ncbi:MAG: Gfo/Idh/MocA family oxidoreductase [Pirellulaceae bacterium]|nr:Gfo/Idh/MocA family oxidoreductase [Pirellulaceae bacterium]